METGSLVTYGAPIRTATVEGGQITLQSESVKEITWQGQRIDYQEHLRQSLFSETAFAHYAMRFLDGPLNTLESDGLKKGVETLAKPASSIQPYKKQFNPRCNSRLRSISAATLT